LWPTPNAHDPGFNPETLKPVDKEGNTPEHPNQRWYHPTTGRLVQKGLTQAAKMWPTPTATDEDGGVALDIQINNGRFFRENKNGVKWGVRLRDAIQHTNGGALNPTWVEWLMGFPDGWTDCGD
jgi:hypothetical protein